MLPHDARFTELKIQRRLELIQPTIYRKSAPLAPFRILPLENALTLPPLDANDSSWDVIAHNSYWGEKHLNFALSGTFTIPSDFDPASPVALFLPLGVSGDFDHPEALIYIDGEPYSGCDRNHREIRLSDKWRGGQPHRLLLHGWCGLMGGTEIPAGRKLFMETPRVVQVDLPTRAYIAAARAASVAAKHLDKNNPSRDRLYNALDHAFKVLDTRAPLGDTFYDSLPAAHEALNDGIAASGDALDVYIAATGHAHIDLAWLWTIDQTKRKGERTFANVLRLMDEFPEFRFVQSQPQLYDWVRQDQPAIFEQIKQRVAEGRWELIGGMWVEADCNIPSGESLVRQFLLGRRFFKDQFGDDVESPVLWLPDVFGYAWNLPQLIKQAGLEYFFTIKIGWNQTNRLPYDSFWWQGLDGTRVLTHFSTAPEAANINSRATYNAEVDSMVALGTWINYQQKHLHDEILMSYGWGDGGGGPTREMIEQARELDTMASIPQVRQSRVIDFFRRLETNAGDKLPVWNGELYLEAHRGTYTTQARNKTNNRDSEFALHNAEFLATVASLLDKNYQYPHETFQRAWELLCLNQFHDIIPGSSIGAVYEDSRRDYHEIAHLQNEISEAALTVISMNTGGNFMVINPSGAFMNGVLKWDHSPQVQALFNEHGSPCHIQAIDENASWVTLPGGVLPYTIMALIEKAGDSPAYEHYEYAEYMTATPECLDNGRVRIEFNAAGDITRIFYRDTGREILPKGAIGNQFQAFEDRPNNWDAWDIDVFFEDRLTLAQPAESIRVTESGDLRYKVEIKRRMLNSDYTQEISLDADSTHIDFRTSIDWRERHTLLKVAFPVDVLATHATFEVQFGNVERPTTQNSSWDWARFESCAHKWVMLREGNFGVSLINDNKYGHDIKDNIMRLSLLRSSTSPDPSADAGIHTFGYRLLLDADLPSTVQSAYNVNNRAFIDLNIQSDAKLPRTFTFVEDLSEDVLVYIETIKRAQDDNGVIVRLYEYGRTRGAVTLDFGFPIRAAYLTNILEENQLMLEVVDQARITFPITPFQIVTLRLISAV